MVELRNITKQYPGKRKKANNDISLDIRQGEIFCVAGENGAGKSTLMKILMGLETPDFGEIFIDGKKEEISSPLAAKKLGIGMVHQHFMLFPEYTVAENIVMGVEPRKWCVFFDSKKAEKSADKIISEHGFAINSRQKVKDLSLGETQQVEICRILRRNARIIILDEPTSILTEQETGALFKTLKALASTGKTIVLITHKPLEIKRVCDRVAILRRGKLTGICPVDSIDEYEIARMMMGDIDFSRKPYSENTEARKTRKNTEPVIEFENVTVKRRGQESPLLDNVSFSVGAGEILGFAGVGGNGLGVIEAVLGGFLHPARGRVLHRGRDISNLSTRALRNQGLAYVPADRLRFGSAGDATIEENMIINRRHEFAGGMTINKKAVKEFSKKLAQIYNIEGAGGSEKCSNLSGGNLQKLILAREINWFRDYIVFSEPTWGLDIASSRFIMGEIDALRGKGAAVILISTNLDEILALADRIIVMYKGKISGEFSNTADVLTKDAIGSCMQGLEVKE